MKKGLNLVPAAAKPTLLMILSWRFKSYSKGVLSIGNGEGALAIMDEDKKVVLERERADETVVDSYLEVESTLPLSKNVYFSVSSKSIE